MRSRRCSAPSSSSTERRPTTGPSTALASPARSWSGEPRNTCFASSGSNTITKHGSNRLRKVTTSPYRRRFASIQREGWKMKPAVCIQRGSARAGRQAGGGFRVHRHSLPGAPRLVVVRGEPRQRERAEQEAEVAQRDVVVARERQQGDDDAAQPGRHHVGAVAGLERHREPGHDLHGAHDVHEVLPAARRDVVDPRREVDRPVHQHVEELVEAERDRRDGERQPHDRERLIARIRPAALPLGASVRGGRRRPRAPASAHRWLADI